MAGKDVAKAEPTEMMDYGDHAGGGFEGVESSELSIPFINVLQSNSPEVEEQTIEGAVSGDLLNTVTQELSKSIVFQPVYREQAWVEWIPRNKGGGFVAVHDPNSQEIQDLIAENKGSRIPPKGSDGKRIPFRIGDNEVIETYYFYGMLLDEEAGEHVGFAVISFTSTKIKVYRDWLTSMRIMRGKPPLWAFRVKLTTVRQKNDSGSYYNYHVTPIGGTWGSCLINPQTETELLTGAMEFKKLIESGFARADFASQQNAGTGGDGDASGEDAPF